MKKKLARAFEYWQRMMESTQRKMSRGAQNITKLISTAHGDNWRRGNRRDKK